MSSKVDAYEKLGAFYLGRECDVSSGEVSDTPLLYDSKDLVTHAVCVGMTGSGKTGLCVTMLEEAAIDGIPALIVDVKGDLGNLLLTFPDLEAKDFQPWVDAGEAARKGLEPEAFAQQQAELWSKGLAKWDQDGERIRRLRDAAEFAIYTPGSEAGRPISILSSFDAPPAIVLEDNDLLQERIATTTAGLLALLGIDADPIQSRESILLSNLLAHSWQQSQNLDLPSLIQQIQQPPIDKVGVMPLETFYPSKERFTLAMALNNLLAAPSFQSWLTGTPLDIDSLLYTAEGKPRIAILSIAHLDDAERMFFVSMLLNQALGWMRGCSGTSSLRALLYMDEIFGYLPPTGNPPSKKPLLTMLKQARAFGFGVVLATQNPVDLDYKALSNIGTWFVGRLQTERDKERLMDGLLSGEGGLSRKQIETLLSGLDKRVFLLHNVHEDEPVLFRVRWAMSYLRGPLTRREIQQLTDDAPAETAPPPPPPAPRAVAAVAAAAGAGGANDGGADTDEAAARPLLPTGIHQRFLPHRGSGAPTYRPHLLAHARVHFVDSRRGLETSEELLCLANFDDGNVDWHEADMLADVDADDLAKEPMSHARFAELPNSAASSKSYTAWKKACADMLYRSRRYELFEFKALKLISEPGEDERTFRIRLREAAREKRDVEVEKLRKKYKRRLETVEGRVRRAEQKVEREAQQAKEHKFQTVISMGTTILGAFLGRKKLSSTNLGRASSAARRMSRSAKEGRDVDLAEEDLRALQQQYEELERELEDEIAELESRFDLEYAELETRALKPRRTDIDIRLFALGWAPYVQEGGMLEPSW